VVSVLNEYIGRIFVPRQVAEHQAIRSFLRYRYSPELATCSSRQFYQETFGAKNHFVLTIAIPIVNLASNVMVPVLSPNVRITPTPQDRSIQALSNRCTGIMHIVFIEILRSNNVDYAVPIQIASNDPLPSIFGIEKNDFPRLNDWYIFIQLADVFSVEIEEVISSCMAKGAWGK